MRENFISSLISETLELKQHETILEINLDAIVHNYNLFKSKLRPETKIICMVKAFGYGAGSYELAKTLQDRGADFLAVAVADEGAELRKAGITMPILVMNPEMSSFRTLFSYYLEPEIYSFELLRAIIAEGEKLGLAGYPVHIKIDSGMHRLGFEERIWNKSWKFSTTKPSSSPVRSFLISQEATKKIRRLFSSSNRNILPLCRLPTTTLQA